MTTRGGIVVGMVPPVPAADIFNQLAQQLKISKEQLITNIAIAGLTAIGLVATVYALQQQPRQPPPPPPPSTARLSATISSTSLPQGSTTPLTIDVIYTKQDGTPLPNYELYLKMYKSSGGGGGGGEDVTASVAGGAAIATARTDANGKARFTLNISTLLQGQYSIIVSDNKNELGFLQQQQQQQAYSISVPSL
ncbi:MAG: hypothetical protein QXM92_02930 [Candidatus Anstonellales archaeon]